MTNLELLPASIDDLALQILHLRTEMRAEFSAVRSEMGGLGAALRQEIADQGVTLRRDIEGLATHMRVLHEEVIAREREKCRLHEHLPDDASPFVTI